MTFCLYIMHQINSELQSNHKWWLSSVEFGETLDQLYEIIFYFSDHLWYLLIFFRKKGQSKNVLLIRQNPSQQSPREKFAELFIRTIQRLAEFTWSSFSWRHNDVGDGPTWKYSKMQTSLPGLECDGISDDQKHKKDTMRREAESLAARMKKGTIKPRDGRPQFLYSYF